MHRDQPDGLIFGVVVVAVLSGSCGVCLVIWRERNAFECILIGIPGALIVRAATMSRIEKAEPSVRSEEPAVGENASRWLWLRRR